MYFTDAGIEKLDERRGDEQVSMAWLAERLRDFVDLNPEFDTAVDRLPAPAGGRGGGTRRWTGSRPGWRGWRRTPTATATGTTPARTSNGRSDGTGSATRAPGSC